MRSGQWAVDGHNRAARLALSCSADRSAVYRRKRLYTLTTMELRFLAGQIESSTDVARLRAESDSYARRLERTCAKKITDPFFKRPVQILVHAQVFRVHAQPRYHSV